MTVKLVDNKQDKPNSLVDDKRVWFVLMGHQESLVDNKRVWFAWCGITSSSVSCWNNRAWRERLFWFGWCGRASDVEIAKRLRKIKTRLGFIALVVDACHCILIQRSNKAIKENSRCHKSLNGKFVLRIHKYTNNIIINQLMDIFSN